jgi:hypothetical protein
MRRVQQVGLPKLLILISIKRVDAIVFGCHEQDVVYLPTDAQCAGYF